MSAEPIYAGRCLINAEVIQTPNRIGLRNAAGVRVMQSSSGGGDAHYSPASDVYLYVDAKDAQVIAAFFSAIALKLQGITK